MIIWKLKPFLEQHDISAYALAKEVAAKLSSNTIYSLVRETPKRVDIESLEAILVALRDMTGQKVDIHHLLEYKESRRSKGKG
jgi:DNA-binding Xre family transcriptional regulator